MIGKTEYIRCFLKHQSIGDIFSCALCSITEFNAEDFFTLIKNTVSAIAFKLSQRRIFLFKNYFSSGVIKEFCLVTILISKAYPKKAGSLKIRKLNIYRKCGKYCSITLFCNHGSTIDICINLFQVLHVEVAHQRIYSAIFFILYLDDAEGPVAHIIRIEQLLFIFAEGGIISVFKAGGICFLFK